MASVLNFFLLHLLSAYALLYLVSSQNPSGFISLDCGLPANVRYEEPNTGIIYDSDAAFIDTGTIHNISFDGIKNHSQPLWSLRSFPKGTRNCYRVRVKSGTKYLIRASFLYGDYDGRKKLPGFDLHIGPNFWTAVNLSEIDMAKHLEIIHVVPLNYLEVCLVNSGIGTPFISALELRALGNFPYPTGSPSLSLANFLRLDVGSLNHQTYRFKDDVYDRIWQPMAPLPEWTSLTTSNPIDVDGGLLYFPAPAVMKSAATPREASAPLKFQFIPPPPDDNTAGVFVYMYFSEFQKLQSNESRVFDVMLNGKRWLKDPLSPPFLTQIVCFSTKPMIDRMFNYSIIKTANSTLPPVLNAIEAYMAINFLLFHTNQQDVESISNIKAVYGVEKNWQGDPCAPLAFIWQGVNCSIADSSPPRIISLNLSSSGLAGKIAKDIANLEMLESLDLSNNNLNGTVPEFLAQLPSLKALNLERNNLSGVIPSQLIAKFNDGSLSLSFGENPNLFITTPSEHRKNNAVVPLAASVGGLFVLLLLLISFIIFWINTKQRKQQAAMSGRYEESVEEQSQEWGTDKKCYSYSEILSMTNNFERALGQGGFGRVYYGKINDTEVAVKMLSPQSTQGHQQFEAEVEVLMRVHHKNLTGLVGYCNEPNNKGLIYEYMGGGNLRSLISGRQSTKVLNWKDRLLIAVDAAHGLEYLHHGVKPAIIHRDIKSTNVLLDNSFRAKISDFGLSRIFPVESEATHVTVTHVVGTYGYIDPEYRSTFKLNKKSDVYGFGVILLEIITGKAALIRTEEQVIHVYQWVQPLLAQGDIQSIIDPKMEEDLDVNSVWKAVDIAMCCVSVKSIDRPNMSQVLVELKECLAMELVRCNHSQPKSFVANSSVQFGPKPR